MEVSKLNFITIKVAGTKLKQAVLDKLADVEVDTSLHVPDMFVINFYDDELELMDSDTFKLGDEVEISFSTVLEDSPDIRPVISGEITAIEPNFGDDLTAKLTIRGYDRSHRLLRGTHSKTYIQMTDADIVKEVADKVGLSVNATSTPVVYDHVFQHNQTDLEFIHDRARRNGYEVVVDRKTLYFRPPQGERGSVTLKWGQDLKQFRPRVTLSQQVKEVNVHGWDPTKKKEITGRATTSDKSPRIGSQFKNGGNLAERVFNSASRLSVRYPVTKPREADRLAQAILDTISTDFIQAQGTADGNPDLVAGNEVNIPNIGTRYSGKYVITSAVHYYSNDGYEVDFVVEGAQRSLFADLIHNGTLRDGATGSRWLGIVPAIVTNNDDPDNMGRVKVRYPWLDANLESDWARVISPSSGKERGIYWLPEIDDEVMVGFEHGDFDQPYVMGGVWNGKDKPAEPIGQVVEGGDVVRRTFKSRLGHTIEMIDKGKAGHHIKIFDGDNVNTMTFDAKGKVFDLNCTGEVKVSAAKTITVNGSADIKISGKTTVQISSNATLNVQAKTMSLKSDTTLSLQGQVVNIKGSAVNIN